MLSWHSIRELTAIYIRAHNQVHTYTHTHTHTHKHPYLPTTTKERRHTGSIRTDKRPSHLRHRRRPARQAGADPDRHPGREAPLPASLRGQHAPHGLCQGPDHRVHPAGVWVHRPGRGRCTDHLWRGQDRGESVSFDDYVTLLWCPYYFATYLIRSKQNIKFRCSTLPSSPSPA